MQALKDMHKICMTQDIIYFRGIIQFADWESYEFARFLLFSYWLSSALVFASRLRWELINYSNRFLRCGFSWIFSEFSVLERETCLLTFVSYFESWKHESIRLLLCVLLSLPAISEIESFLSRRKRLFS